MRTGGNPFNDGTGIAVTHSTRGAALVGRVGLAQKIVFAFRAARRHERRPFVTVVAAGGRRRRGVGLSAKKHGRYERESQVKTSSSRRCSRQTRMAWWSLDDTAKQELTARRQFRREGSREVAGRRSRQWRIRTSDWPRTVEMRIWIRDANLRQKVQSTYIICESMASDAPSLATSGRKSRLALLVGKSLSAGGRLSP